MRSKNMFGFVLLILIFVFFVNGISKLGDDRRTEEREQLENVLRKTAVACYAAEGAYPTDLEYMKEHYGIVIDEERYTVIYEVIASNLLPDITVLENVYE